MFRRLFGATLCFSLILTTGLLSPTTSAQDSSATRGRRVNTSPEAEVTITVNQQFVNSFLDAIFNNLHEPTMPLSRSDDGASPGGQYGCASEVKLMREENGVRTAMRFEAGHIAGPLAFAGAYSSTLIGCIEFSGWADSDMSLEFDGARQKLMGRFRLREVHLNNMPAIGGGPLINLVQNAIDRRYNPIELLSLDQLSPQVNIKPAGGALRLHAREVRPEVVPGALTLHIVYDFQRG
jgi:hypothetical protein